MTDSIDIVARLRKTCGLDAKLHNQAADEIELLRKECARRAVEIGKLSAHVAELINEREEHDGRNKEQASEIKALRKYSSGLIDRLTVVKHEFELFKTAVANQFGKSLVVKARALNARAVKPRTKSTRKVKRK